MQELFYNKFMRHRGQNPSLSTPVILLIAMMTLLLLIFFLLPPYNLLIIFILITLFSLALGQFIFVVSRRRDISLLFGLPMFFLLALRALRVLDLITGAILGAFTLILIIFLLKKDTISNQET